MKNVLMCTMIVASLSACGSNVSQQGGQGPQGPQGEPGVTTTVTVPLPTPTVDAVSEAVANYNEYVQNAGANGGHTLQPGLECTLYNIPNMPSSPCLSTSTGASGCTAISTSGGFASVQSFVYTGTNGVFFNQPNEAGTAGFNVLPSNLQSYATNFELVCTGFIVIPDYQGHKFTTTSDDGSLLYIGGALIVNNDGLHSAATVGGNWKPNASQVFSFQLNYFEGPGSVQLNLTADGSEIPSEYFYH